MASMRQRMASGLKGRVTYSSWSFPEPLPTMRSKEAGATTIRAGMRRPPSWRTLYSASDASKSVSPSMIAMPTIGVCLEDGLEFVLAS